MPMVLVQIAWLNLWDKGEIALINQRGEKEEERGVCPSDSRYVDQGGILVVAVEERGFVEGGGSTSLCLVGLLAVVLCCAVNG
jgi:hypothetical protein